MDYWQKQGSEPLFKDLLWSRPENKRTAGKLLIIGGNLHNFNAPAKAYQAAEKAGIGVAKVLLPEGLRKTIGTSLENCEFAPMNKSGSFAKEALADWLEMARWADCVLLAGDVGRNSETAIVMESFLNKYQGPLVVTQDCLDMVIGSPISLFSRPKTAVVASFGQLQKIWPFLVMEFHMIKYRLPLQQNIEMIHEVSQKIPTAIVTKHNDELIVAFEGQVSTTKNHDSIWRVETAAKVAVWWLQNPSKPFEAITTSVTAD